jgi:hypothetical protein
MTTGRLREPIRKTLGGGGEIAGAAKRKVLEILAVNAGGEISVNDRTHLPTRKSA